MRTLLFGGIAIYLLVCLACGMLRGLSKVRVRCITILVSAVGAVLTVMLVKDAVVLDDATLAALENALRNVENNEVIRELIHMSPTLVETLLHYATALLAPVLCLVFFLLYCFVTWLIYLIISLCCRKTFRRHNENARFRLLRTVALSVVQGLLAVAIVLIPVAVYSDIAADALDVVMNSDALTEEEKNVLEANAESPVAELNRSATLKVYRFLGGKALTGAVTSFEVGDKTLDLYEETSAVVKFGIGITGVAGSKLENYGPREAAAFLVIADSFENSEVLPSIAGEFVYHVTEAWLEDEQFLGIEPPELEGDATILNPTLTAIFEIFNTDAKDTEALRADLCTVSEMVSLLAEKGVFSSLAATDDASDLLSSLGESGVVGELVTMLGSNEKGSMKRLITEINMLGMRAIAQALELPENKAEVREQFLADVADTLNTLKAENGEVTVTELSEELQTVFDEAGLQIDTQILDCYSASLIEDLVNGNDRDVTPEDVGAFFTNVALNVEMERALASAGNSTAPIALRLVRPDLFRGTVYERMDEEQLANSGAAALARVCYRLSAMTQEELLEQATAMILDAYRDVVSDTTPLESIVVTAQLKENSLTITTSIASADSIMTVRVTLEDLTVDTEEATGKINSSNLDAEAAAVEALFRSASALLSVTSGDSMNLSDVAGSVGNVLNSLSSAASFGSERTANVFTAVLQSETVRKTANIDMETATQLAQKGTSGENVDYEKTMNSVAAGIDVMTSFGADGEEIDEAKLTELIENINPQTAAMLGIYVTADRMVGYGIPAEKAPLSASLLADTFTHMAMDNEKDFQKDAKAVNQLLKIAQAAKETAPESKKLFGDAVPPAYECVNAIMGSPSVLASFKENLTDGEQVTVTDPFGLGAYLDSDSARGTDILEFESAMNAYLVANPGTDLLAARAVCAIFGISDMFLNAR